MRSSTFVLGTSLSALLAVASLAGCRAAPSTTTPTTNDLAAQRAEGQAALAGRWRLALDSPTASMSTTYTFGHDGTLRVDNVGRSTIFKHRFSWRGMYEVLSDRALRLHLKGETAEDQQVLAPHTYDEFYTNGDELILSTRGDPLSVTKLTRVK